MKKRTPRPAKSKSGRRNPKSKFWKPLSPSAKLAAVIGNEPITRTEMVSKLWAYIRRNKLQSRANPRMIKADEPLKAVVRGKASVDMFEMTKLAHRHLGPGDGTDDPGPSIARHHK